MKRSSGIRLHPRSRSHATPNQPVFVVTSRYRGKGLHTTDQKWISQDTREELTEVIGWAPWPQAGVTGRLYA